MNKNQRMNRMGVLLMIWAAACLNSHAQQDSAKVLSNSKEEGNRNVMLNAASANGPREISIGLPGGDVNVLENGLPVVYNSNPHNVNIIGAETVVWDIPDCLKYPKRPLLPETSVML